MNPVCRTRHRVVLLAMRATEAYRGHPEHGADCECDCTARLEAKLAQRGAAFLEALRAAAGANPA